VNRGKLNNKYITRIKIIKERGYYNMEKKSFNELPDKIYKDNKEYRLVVIRNRGKYVAMDGSAINPFRKNQKVTTFLNEDGYPCFGGSIPVHLYVAYGWLQGYFDGYEIDHIDFDRTNFKCSNLQWVSHENNVQRSVKNNTVKWNKSKQGTNNGRSIFTCEDVKRIRHMFDVEHQSIAEIIKTFYPQLKTAKQYKSVYSRFSSVCHGKTWKNI
jgi:hypothetical protein